MIRLRKILLFSPLYIIIFVVSVLYIFIHVNTNQTSSYKGCEKKISGEVENLSYKGNKLTLTIKNNTKESVIANYYIDTKEHLIEIKNNLSLGDIVELEGELVKPSSSGNFYSFSYPDYLKYKNIYYLMEVETFNILNKNHSLFITLKTLIRNRILNFNSKAADYINVFFLGVDSNFNQDLIDDFQKLGISHLFALSGTQISFLILILEKILNKIRGLDKFKFLSIIFIVGLYYLIVENCAAIDRAIIFSLIFSINKYFNFNIKPLFLVLLSLSILFFMNPYYIYDIGFQYSTIISCTLLLFMKEKNVKSKIIELLKISWVSFLVSLPISLYNFSYINPLSIIYNLFYVPFINVIIFPLAMICFFIPFLIPILEFFINIFEFTITLLSNIKFGSIVFARIPLIFYFLYYVFIFSYLYFKRKKLILTIFFILLSLHYLYPKLNCKDALYMIDVGQGDSFLFVSNNKSLLLDTGGVMDYNYEEWKKYEKTKRGKYTVTFLKQLGIEKIDYLVLSHGDYDHAGEAVTIMKEMKVNNVFFNSNDLNNLEKEIWDKSDNKRKLVEGDSFSLGNFNFLVISNKYEDENDGSLVFYITIKDKTMLFMGDASIKSEDYILNNYDISDITILKVGHHGSRTSSSEEFIDKVNPIYALVSAGVDNKFNHPHKEVIKRLEDNNTMIYDVRKRGMVMFDFTNDVIKTNKKIVL